MGYIPIEIQKIKINRGRDFKTPTETKYLITIEDNGSKWDKTLICDRQDLLKLRETIDKFIQAETTAELLGISEEQGSKIDAFHKSEQLCKDCSLKLTHNCVTCALEIESPLERTLFLEFRKNYIPFQIQYALDHSGEQIDISENKRSKNFSNVLTVADFFIQKKDLKLCVYTDGHTYHERTEDQATRDRKIDRKLQELGYKVLRYTGKEVREKTDKIISDIKKWTDKAYR
jgi:hypothetical protein